MYKREFKHIQILEIVIDANKGADISSCIREGIELAAKEWKNVTLIFNDRKYRISIDTIKSAIESDNEGAFF